MKHQTRKIPPPVTRWLLQRTKHGALFSVLPLDYFAAQPGDLKTETIRQCKTALANTENGRL